MRLVREQSRSVVDVARSLGMHVNTLPGQVLRDGCRDADHQILDASERLVPDPSILSSRSE